MAQFPHVCFALWCKGQYSLVQISSSLFSFFFLDKGGGLKLQYKTTQKGPMPIDQ